MAQFGHPEEPFDVRAHPRRVNLGCGYDKRPGYLNVDAQAFHEPDLLADVRSMPQLPSEHYDEVVAQDVLEHLTRADGEAALVEWTRLLAPSGRLWIRVPDVPSLLRWIEEDDDPGHHKRIMHLLFGTQAYDGDYHLAGYSAVLLGDHLRRAGLERVTAELRDEWLWEIEAFAADARPTLPVAVFWGHGFHPRESDANTTWRWSAARSELLLYAGGRPLDVVLELTLEKGAATVSGIGADERLGTGAHSIALRLDPGANRLHFASDHRISAEGDARELAFRLSHAALGTWACL